MAVAKPKLGEILLRAGVVDPDQLRAALGHQQRWGRRLGQTLIELDALSENDLVRALASQLNLPVVQLDGKKIEDEILDLVPHELAEKHGCLPLFVKEEGGVRTLYLGMEDPSDVEALDDARFRSGLPVAPVMVSQSDLARAISRSYPDANPLPSRSGQTERGGEDSFEELTEPESWMAEATAAAENQRRLAAADGGPGELAEAPIGAADLGQCADPIQKVSSTEMLTALTQVLIAKGLVKSDELEACVRALRSRDSQ